MQTSRAGWMHLVLLTLLDLVPSICLLKHVRVSPTDYVCAVEEWCIEARVTTQLTVARSRRGQHTDLVLR